MRDDKRAVRKLKREIKKAGNKQRRAYLKRSLLDDPEAAHDVEFEFRKNSSKSMNGFDDKG